MMAGMNSRSITKNWDLAVASSALLLIVGGLAAPHIRRLLAPSA
jgi:hypothetical protein